MNRAKEKTVAALVGGVILIGLSFVIAGFVHYKQNIEGFWLSILVGLCGVSLGWLIGLLASPYKKEKQLFSKYAGIISAFATGYLLSLLQPSISEIFHNAQLVEKTEWAIRFLVFVICIISTTIMTYIYRVYFGEEEYKNPSGKNS